MAVPVFRFAGEHADGGMPSATRSLFRAYRLYLHRENGIGVKRLRGCLFTAGGVREEFIGERRRAFESSLGLRMLWG
jgi:hypothetical protein